MGKATITHEYGDGKYRVLMKQARENVDTEIERLNGEVQELNETVASKQVAELAAKANASTALADLDTAIIIQNGDPSPGNTQAVKSNTALVNRRQEEWSAAKRDLAMAEFQRTSVLKRIDVLTTQIPDDAEVDAWCADYNENISGDVGTIETGRVDGHRDPIIYPAGDSGIEAVFDAVRDGLLQSLVAASPEAAFYNMAILPGANKWKPRYRTGTIVSIDIETDTAVVDLDPLVSTNQNLDVNQSTQVTAEVIYMSCNAAAFSVDRRVVVAFLNQDWSQPKVVGFVTDPEPCEPNIAIGYDRLFQPSMGAWGLEYWMTVIHQRTGDVLSNAFNFSNFSLNAGLPNFGQWHDSKHITMRSYSYVAGFPPPMALSVEIGLGNQIKIGDDSPSGLDPYGYGSQGAMANSSNIIVMTRWSYGTTIYNTIDFYDYDKNPVKQIDVSSEDLYSYVGAANESGMIYIGTTYGSGVVKMRITDFDHNVIKEIVAVFRAKVDASPNYFFFGDGFSYGDTEEIIKAYGLDGALLATLTFDKPPPSEEPDPPAGFEGVPYGSVYLLWCATDKRITLAWVYVWEYNLITPNAANNRAKVVIHQYAFDGTDATFYKMLDPILYSAWHVGNQIRNVYK